MPDRAVEYQSLDGFAFMVSQISYEKTADFIRAVKRRHMARLARKNFCFYLPVGIVGLFGVMGSLHSGKGAGMFWLLIGIFILPLAAWALHFLATGYISLAGPAPHFTARIEPESITVTSDKASSTLLWSQVTAMWRFPDLIFIFWDRKTDLDHAIALPTSSLGADLADSLKTKLDNMAESSLNIAGVNAGCA